MNLTQQEFLQAHATDGVLSPAHAAEFLELAMGDTGTTLPDDGGEPSATPAAGEGTTGVQDQAEPGAQTPPSEPDPANTVIMAKDGKHTIPYTKLEEARRGEQHWKAQATQAQQQLEAALAQAQQRQDAGVAPTAADNAAAVAAAAIESGEVNPEIFGDFSEAAIAKGVATLVDARVSAALGQFKKELQPITAKHQESEVDAHYNTIYEKHPDADSIYESKELADWINRQPSFTRKAYLAVLDEKTGGTAQEVIELFDAFKEATGATQAAGTADKVDPKAAAKAAVANAQAAVPASLSDIPGGRPGAASRYEQLDRLDPMALAEALADMPQAQRELYLSRQM